MTSASIKPQSVASQVNVAQARALPLPAGMTDIDTNSMEQLYFHACVFGPTNSRKTYTAATFAGPEDTRIIVTRNPSQLLPLKGMGYKAKVVDNWNALEFALLYPEKLWPEWASLPNRTLVIDDLTEVAELALEDNSTNEQGKEVRDVRLKFRGAKSDMRGIFKATLNKPQNVIFTALVRVSDDRIRGTECVVPEVPPSIFEMLGAEIEYAFYIDDSKWKFLTQKEQFAIQLGEIDPNTRQPKVARREIFAKYKQPKMAPQLLQKYEDMDLKTIWDKVRK